jgi:hypothetical protein
VSNPILDARAAREAAEAVPAGLRDGTVSFRPGVLADGAAVSVFARDLAAERAIRADEAPAATADATDTVDATGTTGTLSLDPGDYFCRADATGEVVAFTVDLNWTAE